MDGPLRGIRRRGLLQAGAGLAATSTAARAATADYPPDVPPWMHEQGAPLLTPPYGVPSRFEAGVVRRETRMPSIPSVGSSLTPLQDLHGIITPSGLHYERHHGGVRRLTRRSTASSCTGWSSGRSCSRLMT